MKTRLFMISLAAALPVVARGGPLPAAEEAPAVAAPALPADVFARPSADEVQDVLFVGDEHPVVLRFRVKSEGRGFRSVWAEFAARLHRYLDADRDGILTAKEARRGNWQQVLQVNQGNNGLNLLGGSKSGLDANKDGLVSLEELSNYLRSSLSFDEFGVQAGQAPDARQQAAFGQLDANHDARLSPAERAATDGLVARLDADEDEMVSLDEMKPGSNPYANQFVFNGNQNRYNQDTGAFVPLEPGKARARLARRLMGKYDVDRPEGPAKDEQLTRDELGADEASFRAADADGDGTLDAKELEHWIGLAPPALVLDVTLGKMGQAASTIEVARDGSPLAEKVRRSNEGHPVVDLQGVAIEFRAEEVFGDNREFFKQQFKGADTDNNGYVDKKESAANFQVQQFFQAADRDGDGKLFENEYVAFLDQQQDATQSRAMLTVTDRGRPLYELLDADRDQRLGVRELREARKRLEKLDRNGDGLVELVDIPRQYRLGVGRGLGNFGVGITVVTYDSPRPAAPGSADSPSWFRHMDRNGDGDVSPREFLGPREDFARFDRDGDGLIDPKEAAQGP